MGGLLMPLSEEETKEIARKQEIVTLLNSSGALDVRGGCVTLHFDGEGMLRKIERSDTLLRI